MSFTSTPNMQMPLPTVSGEAGPQFATDVNQCLSILDNHSHNPGQGVPIGSQGISLQTDLSFNTVNAINLRTTRYVSTTATSGTDVGCVYVRGIDLYFNDLNGNVVRITQSGGLSSTAQFIGSISTTAITSAAGPTPASSGFVRMNNNTDFVSWRNSSNNADDKVYFDNTDAFVIVGGAIKVTSFASTGTQGLTVNSAGLISARSNIQPNPTVLTSGTGSYNPPSSALYLRVMMVGGGAGGGGGGGNTVNKGGSGAAGTATVFGSGAFLVQASGGVGGGGASSGSQVDGGSGGSGGSVSLGSAVLPVLTITGGSGGGGPVGLGGVTACGISGGPGGNSVFCGAGLPGAPGYTSFVIAGAGGNAITNSGSGGAGGGGTTTGGTELLPGGGGGAGGYADVIVPASSGAYFYSVGLAGSSGFGNASQGCSNGGAGAAGQIIIIPYFQ